MSLALDGRNLLHNNFLMLSFLALEITKKKRKLCKEVAIKYLL